MERTKAIVDNRLVSDETFALRLLSFVEQTEVCDPCSEEERDYLIGVAKLLLQHQIFTVKGADEINYLDMNNAIQRAFGTSKVILYRSRQGQLAGATELFKRHNAKMQSASTMHAVPLKVQGTTSSTRRHDI